MVKRLGQPIAADNYIAGTWKSGGGAKVAVTSPYDNEAMGYYHESLEADVDEAVQAAAAAYTDWASTPLKERCSLLFKVRDSLLHKLEDIANIVALESGKTIGEARAGLLKGIEVLEFATALQNSDLGGKSAVSRGVHCEYRRYPLGVVGSITPFNFPAMVPFWTIPIAIALGNAYVWKPSEKTPCASVPLTEIFSEAGLPPGILTVVQGGKKVAETICTHPKIAAVGFVGSSAAAEAVYQQATKKGKRALALGGAKNHIILLPDADLALSGKGIADSFTGCAGQRCMAASVLLAVGDVDHLIESIKSHAQSVQLGQSMGAIITQEQRLCLEDAVSAAEKRGAKILLDGRKPDVPKEFPNGNWFGPTILDQVNPSDLAARDEMFGPILTIVRCATITEALDIQNSNPYGNACSVFTSNGGLAEKVVDSAHCGMAGINIGVPVPREPFSFGGIGQSRFGHGDITGYGGVEFWSQLKKITTKWNQQSDANWMS
ncbi:MAG: aldehyde dehydrogenase family protein [Pseudobacteriovorax sp.]|nr:aldehyde dehydrogenase family protein [Pseudobacteriovorax sp.]